MKKVRLFAVFAALVLVVAGVAVYVITVPPPVSAAPLFAIQINNVIILLMENRAYDNYFETYCLKLGPYCSDTGVGVAPGTCLPQMNVVGGCVVPYNFTTKNFSTPDMPHSYNATTHSIDGGKEDGYYTAEEGGLEPFGHYNGTTIPVYWDLAQEFALGDDFYSSALSYSLPNHWYLVAGQAPPIIIKSNFNTSTERHTYLDQSNTTRTVEDLLNNSKVTWKYYDWPLSNYATAIETPTTSNGINTNGPGVGSAYALWNPMAARAESYKTYLDSHFVARTGFFSDVRGRTLPDVSYVIPQVSFSDHAPENITQGEAFVANVVDSVEFSSYWNHTAILLMWDDYGGWFDNVAPPYLDPLGLSSRVPLVVVSPYTPAGLIVNSLGYLESTLSFIEHRWGLTKDCLTARDCDAPDLSNYFDFSMKPRAPVFFDPNWLDDTYPYHHEDYTASTLDTTTWTGSDADLTDDEAD